MPAFLPVPDFIFVVYDVSLDSVQRQELLVHSSGPEAVHAHEAQRNVVCFSLKDQIADLDQIFQQLPAGLGLGDPVLDSRGEPLRYSCDGAYYLDRDIPMPDGAPWRIDPEFTGSFSGPDEADGKRLYDESGDVIYIQNLYQLSALFAEDRDSLPVITGDTDIYSFGRGQLIFPSVGGDEKTAAKEESPDTEKEEQESETGFLTYGAEHHYVLSAAFTAELKSPLLKAKGLRSAATGDNSDRVDGRDYFGQITVDIAGTTYILIGDRQQLDAINSDAVTRTAVYGPVYSITQTYTRLGAAN